MTITLPQIRQAMLDADFVDGDYGTATAGAVGTLTDTTKLAVGGSPKSKWGRFHLHRPNAATASDKHRLVAATGFASSTGVLTHGGPNWTVAPLASADDGTYELWKYPVLEVNRAVNRALTDRCWILNKDSVTPTGATRYDVSASPFSLTIESLERQIVDIEQVFGSVPNQIVNRWSERQAGGRFYIEQDAGSEFLYTDPPLTGTIRLIWISSFTALADETTTSTLTLDYAVWAAWYELLITRWQRARSRGLPSQEIRTLADSAFARYDALYREELGRYASHVHERGSDTTGLQAVAVPNMGGVNR